MLTVCRRVVTHHDCKTLGSFDTQELVLEPGEHMTWVVAFPPDVEVEGIANVSVDSNDLGTFRHTLAIFKFDVKRVVSELPILSCCIFTDPLSPHIFVMVDCVVLVGLSKVFLVDRPGVVVSLDRNYSDLFALDRIFDSVRDFVSVFCHFFHAVAPNVVGGIITSPEDNIWLDLISDEFHHVSESLLGEVALASIVTPLTRGPFTGVSHAVFSPTAEIAATVYFGAYSVLSVNVCVREVHGFYCIALGLGLTDLEVQVVDKVIVFETLWLRG